MSDKSPTPIHRDGKTYTWRFNISAENAQETNEGVLILSVDELIEDAILELPSITGQPYGLDLSECGLYLPEGTSSPRY